MEFEAGETVTSLNFIQIALINVQAHDPIRHRGIDLFQAVTAGNSHDRNALRTAEIQTAFE